MFSIGFMQWQRIQHTNRIVRQKQFEWRYLQGFAFNVSIQSKLFKSDFSHHLFLRWYFHCKCKSNSMAFDRTMGNQETPFQFGSLILKSINILYEQAFILIYICRWMLMMTMLYSVKTVHSIVGFKWYAPLIRFSWFKSPHNHNDLWWRWHFWMKFSLHRSPFFRSNK